MKGPAPDLERPGPGSKGFGISGGEIRKHFKGKHGKESTMNSSGCSQKLTK